MTETASLRIEPSKQLLAILLILACLACASILISSISLSLKLIVFTGLGAVFFHALRTHYFLTGEASTTALRYQQNGWWLTCGADEVEALLLPASTLTNLLLVLNFRITGTGRKVTVVLLPDSASADSLRKLKVLLRFVVSASKPSSFQFNPHRNNSAV